MPKTKEQKKQILEELKENLIAQKSIVFIGFRGLNVAALSNLRKNIKKAGGKLKVAKNTLMKLAFKRSGLEIKKDFDDQVAVIFSKENEISPIKAVYDFSKENKIIKILGGFFEGKFQEKEAMVSIAQLPSREELLSRLLMTMSSPMSGFVNVLQGNIKGFIRALNAIKDKNNRPTA